MKTLEIVVSKPMPMAGIDVSDYKEAISKACKEGHKPIVIQYIHGIVEDAVHYDIGVCLNGEDCADFDKEKYIEGIYDVKIIGYDNPCKAYLWNADGPRGLIIDPTSEEDKAFAEKKYNLKTVFL